MVNEHASDWCITTAECFSDCLDIWHDAELLPGMKRSSPAHAAHDFIKDKECAVLVAYCLHGLEVAGHGRNASQGLRAYCQHRVSS